MRRGAEERGAFFQTNKYNFINYIQIFDYLKHKRTSNDIMNTASLSGAIVSIQN